MLQKIILLFLNFVTQLSGKKFVYIPKDRLKKIQTAVKSNIGFWYAGNVFNVSDIAYGVAYNGVVEPEGTFLVQKLIGHLMQKNDRVIFYDVGANTGYYGILAAYLGKGKVCTYAFEPLKEFNSVECDSILLNNLSEVCKVFSFALGDKSGKMQITLAGSGSSLSEDFLGNGKLGKEVRLIDMAVLDELQKKENMPLPSFIKIDVEGFEQKMLAGSVLTIESALPIVWFESALTIRANNFENNDFWLTQKFFVSKGYKIFLMSGKSLLEVNDGVEIPDSAQMYLALHQNKHKEIFGLLDL